MGARRCLAAPVWVLALVILFGETAVSPASVLNQALTADGRGTEFVAQPRKNRFAVVWRMATTVHNTVDLAGVAHTVHAVDTTTADARVRLDGPHGLLVSATKLSASAPSACSVHGDGMVRYLKPGALPQVGLLASGIRVNLVVGLSSPLVGERRLVSWHEGSKIAVGVFPAASLRCGARAEAQSSGVWHLGMASDSLSVDFGGEDHTVVAVGTKDRAGARLRLARMGSNPLVGATALAATRGSNCIVTDRYDRGARYLIPSSRSHEGWVGKGTVVTKVVAMHAPTMDKFVLVHWSHGATAFEGVLLIENLSCKH